MLKNAIVVFLKEMKDLMRDKKTFILGLLIPLLLLPMLLFIVDNSMSFMKSDTNSDIYIGINDKDNSFYKFCSTQKNIKIVENIIDMDSAINSGTVSAYIVVGDTLDDDILNKKNLPIDIKFNSSSLDSIMLLNKVTYYKEIYTTMAEYLAENNYISTKQELDTYITDETVINKFLEAYPYQDASQDIDIGLISFNIMIPMMLILYCCIGSSSTASELSAGEKERGTLEALLSTSADRTSIIVGKLLATTLMGVISALCTVLGLSAYLIISSGSPSFSLSFSEFLVFLLITLFTAMFFASINLAIGVYSRSSKEAQTYLAPMSIISALPAYFAYSIGINSIRLEYLCIPVLNVVCIIKEVFARAVNPIHVCVVIFWLVVYISIVFSITTRMFKKENVIFRI